jgi:hypothetical protein
VINGIGAGSPKYMVGVLFSAAVVPLYIFGGGIISLFKTLSYLSQGISAE